MTEIMRNAVSAIKGMVTKPNRLIQVVVQGMPVSQTALLVKMSVFWRR